MHTWWDFCVCSDSSYPLCNSQIRHQDNLLVLAFQIMAKFPKPSKYEWNMNSPQVCQPSKQDLATHWPCTALIIEKKFHDGKRVFFISRGWCQPFARFSNKVSTSLQVSAFSTFDMDFKKSLLKETYINK